MVRDYLFLPAFSRGSVGWGRFLHPAKARLINQPLRFEKFRADGAKNVGHGDGGIGLGGQKGGV